MCVKKMKMNVIKTKIDEKGFVSFINSDSTNETSSMNHPCLVEILENMNEKHTQIKYFTYRCAGKVFELQNVLQTNRIPYQLILGILDRHRMQSTSFLTPTKLKEVVFDIYYAAHRLGYFLQEETYDLDTCKFVLLNLVWNIFDPKRNKPSIDVLAFRQLMLLVCESSCFQSKLYEYFDIACDHNQLLPRSKFELMLLYFAKIFAYLDESANQFGSNWISNTVRDCYQQCPGLGGLTQYQFFSLWNSGDTDFANFSNIIALVQRMNESQYVLHHKKCAGCDVFPIKGLRFKCQKCKNLSLCSRCFGTAFVTGKHSTAHKMYEISSVEKKSRSLSTVFSKMCACSSSKSHDFNASLGNKEIKLVEANNQGGESNTSIVKVAAHSTIKRATVNKSIMSGYFNGQQTMSKGVSQAGKLNKLVEALLEEHQTFQNNLNMFRSQLHPEQVQALLKHSEALAEHIKELRDCSQNTFVPFSSTPFRVTARKKRTPLLNASVPLFNSIRGAEINKTFVEENKSLSINDISNWFQIDNGNETKPPLTAETESRPIVDTKMVNFKRLLDQVREIVDDSYSDNALLAEKTKDLENELDHIIAEESERRSQKHG